MHLNNRCPPPLERSKSPRLPAVKEHVAQETTDEDRKELRMHKFSLYETINRFYLVGADIMDRRFRILKIDRTADTGTLNVSEDDIVYSKTEMNRLLNGIDDGNKNSGGLKLKCSTWGLLGFIRFTGELLHGAHFEAEPGCDAGRPLHLPSRWD